MMVVSASKSCNNSLHYYPPMYHTAVALMIIIAEVLMSSEHLAFAAT